MEVVRIGGVLGAEVRDLDLPDASGEELAALVRALGQHQVVVVTGQALDDASHLRIARAFGDPWTSVLHGDGAPAVGYIENDARRPPTTDVWHADSTFERNPPACGILRAVVVPPYGGDTTWASMVAVHDALSPPLRAAVAQLRAEHAVSDEYHASARATGAAPVAGAAADCTTTHPLVCRAAYSDRPAVFYNPRYVRRIVDVDPAESASITGLLDHHLGNPTFQFRWRWRPGDVAIWDQRAVLHRGLSDHFHDGPQHRLVVTTRAVRADAVPGSDAPLGSDVRRSRRRPPAATRG